MLRVPEQPARTLPRMTRYLSAGARAGHDRQIVTRVSISHANRRRTLRRGTGRPQREVVGHGVACYRVTGRSRHRPAAMQMAAAMMTSAFATSIVNWDESHIECEWQRRSWVDDDAAVGSVRHGQVGVLALGEAIATADR
jgi:hypothetical protein